MPRSRKPRLETGRILVTHNCLERLGDAIAEVVPFPPDKEGRDVLAQIAIQLVMRRHQRHDWGTVDDADKAANDRALVSGARILSAYEIRGIKVWLMTDAETDACPACHAGIDECEPDKGSWVEWTGSTPGRTHFRDDLPPRRLATTVLLPEDY